MAKVIKFDAHIITEDGDTTRVVGYAPLDEILRGYIHSGYAGENENISFHQYEDCEGEGQPLDHMDNDYIEFNKIRIDDEELEEKPDNDIVAKFKALEERMLRIENANRENA